MKTWIAIARDVVDKFGKDSGTMLAAAIAYYTLLSIFPMILGLLALIGVVISDATTRLQFVLIIAGIFPGASELIQSATSNVVAGRGIAGIIATVGLIWSASGIFGVISTALDRVWDAPHDRNFVLTAVLSVIAVLAIGLMFIVSLFLSAALQLARQFSMPFFSISLDRIPLLFPLIDFALPFLVALGIFTLMYRFVPNVTLSWRFAWPGGLLATVLFEAAKQGFAFYLVTFAHLNAVYGSVGAVIALVTFAYYAALVLIIGGEFNASLSRHAEASRPPIPLAQFRRNREQRSGQGS